jgi:hypothetical protein
VSAVVLGTIAGDSRSEARLAIDACALVPMSGGGPALGVAM